MSEAAIEPSAVISPRGEVATRGGAPAPIQTGRQKFYDTYNTRDIPIGGDGGATPPTPPGTRAAAGQANSVFVRLPGGGQPVSTPKFLPQFLGSRSIILFSWAAAMVMVSLDEWHTYGILPRPARLWDTSLTFMLIAGVSTFDPLVPICTIFSIGLVIALGYQYYTGAGQFGQFGAAEANDTPLPKPGTGGNTQNE